MKLSELENKLCIKVPEKMRSIYETGAMEWLETTHEEFMANRERFINDPKAFLMLNCDCEPLRFEQWEERSTEIDEWLEWKTESEDNFTLKEGIKLIPFAIMGTGDNYCLMYEGDNEPKVVLCYHDSSDDPDIIGNDFDMFLYVIMLNAAAWDEDIEGEPWNEHLNYLSEEYRNKLIGRSADDITDEFENMRYQKAKLI